MMKVTQVAVLLGLLPAAAFGGFVSMEEGARATGMGGAFTGVSDDATMVFWNPAGFGHTRGFKLTGMRSRIFSVKEISEDCIAVGYSGWRRMGLGFGWTRTGLEDIYNENTFVFGAGRRLGRGGFAVGGALRVYRIAAPGYEYYNDPNFRYSDTGYAGDLGVLYRGRGWSLGCVVRNIGEPELKLIKSSESSDPIYRELRLGGTYVFREVMLITGEIRRPAKIASYYDSKIGYYLGTEIWFFDAFALRSGLHRDRATAGVGLRVEGITVDAALISDRRVGNKYRLSLSLDRVFEKKSPASPPRK